MDQPLKGTNDRPRISIQFIGSPRMDLFRGSLIHSDSESLFDVGPVLFDLPANLAAQLQNVDAAEIDLGIRSENVRLTDSGTPSTVQVVQPIGPETHITVGWSDTDRQLTARVPGISHLAPGDQTHVTLDASGMIFFDSASGNRLEF